MAERILIIEDDLNFKRVLELRLKSFLVAPHVTHLDSLAKAREFLKEEALDDLDLVVLDEHLPDGRGVDLLTEGLFRDMAVLSVSSDDAPDIPGKAVGAGAAYFLSKVRVSEPLFKPLVLGIMDRNKIQKQLVKASLDAAIIDSVKTLVGTLRHEINNPLGAVLGAAYLIRNQKDATKEQQQAADLVEKSGQRIKHVLDQLCQAVELDQIKKANQKVFHIPGDKPWE